MAYGRRDEAACLIFDMRLPDMSGLDLQQRLANEDCPPIIFISGRVDIPGTVQAMKAGAIEFLTKPVSPRALETAIDVAFAQDRKLRKQRLEMATLQSRFNTLTPREREVLPLIAEGLLNKQAAAVLGISEVTLQVHRCQVMRKMAARSFAELVRMAERLGIPAAPERNMRPDDRARFRKLGWIGNETVWHYLPAIDTEVSDGLHARQPGGCRERLQALTPLLKGLQRQIGRRHARTAQKLIRFRPPNPLARRERPQAMPIDTTPLNGALADIRPVSLEQARKTTDEPLFNSLMEQHHYLGYEQPVGEHLKYLVWAQGRPIACMAWSSAPRHLGSRDRYIGWSAEARPAEHSLHCLQRALSGTARNCSNRCANRQVYGRAGNSERPRHRFCERVPAPRTR